MTPNPKYIHQLVELVNRSPFPRHLPMQLTSIALDSASVNLDIAQCHLQPFGMVHGGVFATLIDTATFWSAFLRLPEENGLVNIDLKLNYLKGVARGSLTARGRCLHSGKSSSYAESKVYNDEGELVAHGTSTLIVLTGKGINVGVRKFVDD